MNAVPGADSLTFKPVSSSNCNLVNVLLYVIPSTSDPLILNGTFVKPDALPINEPEITDADIAPTKLIEPVLTVFVTTNSCTEGPPEPETAIKTLPSVVLSANSPSCKLVFVGF